VIRNLREYLAEPDRDLEGELATLAAERERLVAEARARLTGQAPATRERFELLLRAAQAGTAFTEDHAFWIDSYGAYEVRRVLLECGRRLAAAGTIEAPDDVFYLALDEVRGSAAAGARGDRRRLVAARQAKLAYFRTVAPPPALGSPAPSVPPAGDPMNRALAKFWGWGEPPEPPGPAAADRVVRGHAGSPGVARGPARVIRSLAEAGKLRRGDVLVAETTGPPWTPLFATAAAVVTDTGGVLSHCAVVAREYGLPAVVGTGDATALIRDGQPLEVDGGAGLVRLL
jgi:phosphohistidine swiveling domain-containing protein